MRFGYIILKSPECIGYGTNRAKEEQRMDKYECTICGYVYDPVEGDPDSGIPRGTPFEKLPDDFVCPECGVPKDMFERIN